MKIPTDAVIYLLNNSRLFYSEEVLQCRQRLWPQRPFKDDGDKKDLEDKEKERKRIARERQQKLIETFAHQRDEFQKKNIDASGIFSFLECDLRSRRILKLFFKCFNIV